MKRLLAVLISMALVVSLFAGCGSKNTAETTKQENTDASKEATTSTTAEAKPVTLKMMQFKTDLTEALNSMAKEYKDKVANNVTIEIESVGSDYNTVLKTKLNSGEIPDIFMSNGYTDNKTYLDYSYDMTNEDFMKTIDDSTKTAATLDGKIYGLPLLVEAYGLVYNKKLFADAGITEVPQTTAQLEDACKKLQAKGITPFSNGYKEWWVIKHIFSHFYAAEETDYAKLQEDLGSGTKKFADLKNAMKMFDFLDLTLKYGNPKPLETDYNLQTGLVAQGKAAMCHQGTWAEEGMKKITPDLQLGFIPVPVGDDASKSRVMADANILFRLAKDSKNLEESKKWMNWFITSDYGKKFIVETLKFIPTYKGGQPPAGHQLSAETIKFMEGKETYPWVQGFWPDGFEQQQASIFQAYIAKSMTKEQCMVELDKAFQKLAKSTK